MSTLSPVYLINLNESTDRLRLFMERNSHLKNVIRVPATNGRTLDRAALIRSGYITEDLPYGAGTLGSAMSHLKLWELAASEDRAVTIFEDAVVVSQHFEEGARRILGSIPPDWDLIQWGSGFPRAFVWVDFGVAKTRLEAYGGPRYTGNEGLRRFQTDPAAPVAVRIVHSFGIQGYSISAKGARAALEYCLPLRKRMVTFPEAGVVTEDVAIDVALSGLFPAIRGYICLPPLAMRWDADPSIRSAMDTP